MINFKSLMSNYICDLFILELFIYWIVKEINVYILNIILKISFRLFTILSKLNKASQAGGNAKKKFSSRDVLILRGIFCFIMHFYFMTKSLEQLTYIIYVKNENHWNSKRFWSCKINVIMYSCLTLNKLIMSLFLYFNYMISDKLMFIYYCTNEHITFLLQTLDIFVLKVYRHSTPYCDYGWFINIWFIC